MKKLKYLLFVFCWLILSFSSASLLMWLVAGVALMPPLYSLLGVIGSAPIFLMLVFDVKVKKGGEEGI